ncbi:hypothetical protein SDC9_210679 [bioreactor metagenome]|uniref:Uncharacterized protein n=1 Tax=bioreactor metagenome TaxID=1076179 RepID=A0A645JHL2_9ZZZZ
MISPRHRGFDHHLRHRIEHSGAEHRQYRNQAVAPIHLRRFCVEKQRSDGGDSGLHHTVREDVDAAFRTAAQYNADQRPGQTGQDRQQKTESHFTISITHYFQ